MDNPAIDTRHGFLQALHSLLTPATYLEVGVQHGTSLALADRARRAIGIDPEPLIQPTGNQWIYKMTSDEFFATQTDNWEGAVIDLAFIDGLHTAVQAWRDFVNIERYCHPGSVVLFDDTHPRNIHEARRIPEGEPVVGDWTGDVWKLTQVLPAARPNLTVLQVDLHPTGGLLVAGFGQKGHHLQPPPWPNEHVEAELTDPPGAHLDPFPVVLRRDGALPARAALQVLADMGFTNRMEQ